MDLINFEATELRLGLPGSKDDQGETKAAPSPMNNKRSSPEMDSSVSDENDSSRSPPPTK